MVSTELDEDNTNKAVGKKKFFRSLIVKKRCVESVTRWKRKNFQVLEKFSEFFAPKTNSYCGFAKL